MPTIVRRDFSGGWRPGDDPINGAPNGLLQMDNLDLDTNGALSLIGGTSVVGTAFTDNLHSIYSRTMGGTRKIYSADTNGGIFRDNTSIGTGGATDIAAFGTAFNYILACSGNTRKKDAGSGTPVNLGVTAPTAAPAYLGSGRDADGPYIDIASLTSNYAMYIGTATIVTSTTYPSGGGHSRPASIKYLQVTANSDGKAVFQTYNGTSDPHDLTVFSNSGVATDDDIIPFFGYTDNPWGSSLQIDILLGAGNAYADQISDYYTYKVDDISQLQFDPYTGVFHLYIKRSDFTRVGNGEKTWETAYGVRISFSGTDSQVINFLGVRPDPLTSLGGALVTFFGGSKSQNGIYEFAQMNVNNTGSYLAKSPLGPSSGPIQLCGIRAYLDLEVPADSQVNEVWVFARSAGGANEAGISSVLNKWYRVAKQTSSLGSNQFIDTGDLEALELDITHNPNLVTIASSGISDKILAVLGPINKRWYYFTENMMYPSDIDNPDLVDASIAIRTTGSNNEIFLWAKQVDKATVLVGTSCDVYVLSGTFATFPDFTLDIYYHGLGCKYPPITYDADVYSGSVFYLANDGWRFITAGGTNELIVAPQLDKLYKGIDSNGYTAPNLKIAPGSVRFPIIVGKNKLWCFISGTNRCEVFDFTRKYWRAFNYNLGDATCVTGTQDGQIVAFYSSDKKIREIDIKSSKLIDGVTKQTIKLLWTIDDGGTPRNRKDTSVFKTRIYTNSDPIVLYITNDLKQQSAIGFLSSTAAGLDNYIDLSQDTYIGLCKTYQVYLNGQVSDFLLEDWTIDFEQRPNQVSYLKVLPQNFGSGGKKRLRNWPAVLDTLGNTVIWTPDVDGTQFPQTSIVCSRKQTNNLFYTSDAFGVDYGGTFHCTNGLFEFFDMLTPTIVQTLPIAKRFDQVGPEELFKYGKVKQFEFRLLAYGTTIPYTMYFSDTVKQTGNLTTSNGIEDSYFVDVPKGTNGRILRIVLGPTSFDFHRFYSRVQVAESGRDTELNWITIAND